MVVQRYDVYGSGWWFESEDDGEYVRYEDHAAELATLRDEVERLRGSIIRDAKFKLSGIVEWLDQDEDNATLLLSALTPEQFEIAKEALK